MAKVWGGIKKGDTVLETRDPYGSQLHTRKVKVKSVGRSWITIDGGSRFDVENGRGEYGCRLHTETTLAEHKSRSDALSRIRKIVSGYDECVSVSLDTLLRVADLLES